MLPSSTHDVGFLHFEGYDFRVVNTMLLQTDGYLWFGDLVLWAYTLLALTILINLFLAMLGNKFNHLMEKQVLARKLAYYQADRYYMAKV